MFTYQCFLVQLDEQTNMSLRMTFYYGFETKEVTVINEDVYLN